MKKILCLLLVLIFVPSVCLSEQQTNLNTIWGIDIGISASSAAIVAEKATGYKFLPVTSYDEKEIILFQAKLGDSDSLLDVKLKSISIIPRSSPIPANDTTSTWDGIAISFDTASAANSFGVLYEALCAEYGEPNKRKFTTDNFDLSGKTTIDQNFPYFSDGFGTDVVQIVIDSGLQVSLSAIWKNILLDLEFDEGKLSLALYIYAFC